MDPQTTVGCFDIQAGMRIADFGAGSGFFTILMAKLAGPDGLVTAIDVMDSALDSVRAKAKAEALNNIDTIRSNLELLGSSGLADGSQDLVLLKNILFQTEKKREMLAEANRVLKIAGKLVVIDWRPRAEVEPRVEPPSRSQNYPAVEIPKPDIVGGPVAVPLRRDTLEGGPAQREGNFGGETGDSQRRENLGIGTLGAGTPGPPDQFRTETEVMRQLAESVGFNFIGFIDTDVFHYGMIFRKV